MIPTTTHLGHRHIESATGEARIDQGYLLVMHKNDSTNA